MLDKLLIVVGAEDAVQIDAVAAAFRTLGLPARVFHCQATSRVGKQPLQLCSTENGACNRARTATQLQPDADFYIGIESGIVGDDDRYFDQTCVFIRSGEGRESPVLGGSFPLPAWMVHQTLAKNVSLGEFIKEFTDGEYTDPVSYLSEGKLTREQIFSRAVQCALAPLLFPGRYQER